MTDYFNDIVFYALNWWEGKCPEDWTQEQHLSDPKIGCTTTDEKMLAESVARYLRKGNK